MTKKQKLELTWIGKDEVTKLEPRILVEDTELSYHAPKRINESDLFDNKLIFGDNLLALKALEQDYAGKVKCVFIDPPYNTGSAFTHYDDGIEHSLWLSLIRDRIEIIRTLLSADGSLWITIDDNEAHYLKVLCDEIFGRKNFVSNLIWQKKFSPQNDAKFISSQHDHILVYAKNKEQFVINKLFDDNKVDRSRNLDGDERGSWKSVDYTCNKNKTERPNLYYPIKQPNTGEEILPKETAVWRFSRDRHEANVAEGLVYWGKDGKNSVPRFKKFTDANITVGSVPTSIWFHQDVGNTQDAKKEQIKFNELDPFATPKPEKLLQRILEIATNQGDLVLDSFAGSGTTGAVAHKMGRRWIMVELGEHCYTHVLPRLKRVVNGDDMAGVTVSLDWHGGGGFRYYKLAPSLLAKDKWDNWVINKDYDANMLAAAVCKHEGFTYSPSETEWWSHGYSTESDFIFVTTQTLTEEQLLALSEDVGNERTLLVCCSAFKASVAMLNDKLINLTLKKMPHALLSKCEWGKDDYSLNISKLQIAEMDDAEQEIAPKKKEAKKESDLFGKE